MKTRNLNGYVVVYCPDHPRSMRNKNWDGWVYEHIMTAMKMLGRDLREDEEIHHLDFNRSNNDPSNLLVLPKSQHTKLHEWLKAGAPGYERPGENRVNSVKPKFTRRCSQCSAVLFRDQELYCSEKCCRLSRRKVLHRPSLETLEQDIEQLGYLGTGRKYGVTDNCIRKWIRQYRAKLEEADQSTQEGVETRE